MHPAAPAVNPCKQCTPLGACLAFAGISGTLPFLHGSQGCATYIRRYLISHFREPVDIASSSFSEETAVFGGGRNFKTGLLNVASQYRPELIGVATTCLSETIGDDVAGFLRDFRHSEPVAPPVVHVSTPSYRGTQRNGFHDTIRAVVEQLAEAPESSGQAADVPPFYGLFPGMLSPADLRFLKSLFRDFDMEAIMMPDYSKTLDGGLWDKYLKIPPGGTPVSDIRRLGRACGSLEFGHVLAEENSAGKILENRFGIKCHSTGIPIGIGETDRLMTILETLSGKPLPQKYAEQRERLADAYVDSHKYVMGKRVTVFGDEDLVVGLVSFLCEIGMVPVVCAGSGKNPHFEKIVRKIIPARDQDKVTVFKDADFTMIQTASETALPDLFIGGSKGYPLARQLKKPLVRVGFPIHDRIGGPRMRHIGYSGTQRLFDLIVNALLSHRQDNSTVGYAYM